MKKQHLFYKGSMITSNYFKFKSYGGKNQFHFETENTQCTEFNNFKFHLFFK